MYIDLLQGVPPLVMMDVRDGRTSDDHVAGVSFRPPAYQPILGGGERELARVIAETAVGIGVTKDGSRDLSGAAGFSLATAPMVVAAVVATERRLVCTASGGEFFGGLRFDVDRDGRLLLFELRYEDIGSIELEMKQKMLSGAKPFRLNVHVRNPHLGAFMFRPRANTTPDNRPTRNVDLPELFERLSRAVAVHSRDRVDSESEQLISDYLARGPKREDGNPIALFEPEDRFGPSSDSSGESAEPVVDGPAPMGPGYSERDHRLARFCHICGQVFDEEEQFCTGCGIERRAK